MFSLFTRFSQLKPNSSVRIFLIVLLGMGRIKDTVLSNDIKGVFSIIYVCRSTCSVILGFNAKHCPDMCSRHEIIHTVQVLVSRDFAVVSLVPV